LILFTNPDSKTFFFQDSISVLKKSCDQPFAFFAKDLGYFKQSSKLRLDELRFNAFE